MDFRRRTLPSIARPGRGGRRMKEHTYGWYPSAKNVYEDRRMGAPTPYQIEAMYRFRDSKYYQPPITPPEQKKTKPPSQASSQRPATSMSRASQHQPLTLRARSVPINIKYKPPPKLNLPTPLQCWSSPTPEPEVATPPPSAQPPPPSSKHESLRKSATPKATPISLPKSATPIVTPPPPQQVVPTPPVTTPIVIPCAETDATKVPSTTGTSEKLVRVQSAKVRRESATRPQRPVKSAGPVRASPGHLLAPPPQTGESPVQVGATRVSPMPGEKTDFGFVWPQPDPFAEEDMIDRTTPLAFSPLRPTVPTPPASRRPPSSQRAPSLRPSIPSPAERPPSSKTGPLRPKAPSPYKMERMQEEEEEDIFRAETPDYDTELQKHGWLMEVHGNPLNLKKVTRRLPYTVKVDLPETERDPPKVHMENNETFFLNTIPRRPMTFAIDKEWISEMIHAKRVEFQKRHGVNYRYKNFSFVY